MDTFQGVELSSVEPDSSTQPNIYNSIDDGEEEGRRRLLVFLSRYIEGVGRSHDLSPEQVAVLTVISRGESGSEFTLNQTQVAALFGVKPRAVSEVTKKLREKGLCRLLTDEERSSLGIGDERTHYHRLTDQGQDALSDYARLMFDLPAKVKEEISDSREYRALTRHIGEIVERDLAHRFTEARRQ